MSDISLHLFTSHLKSEKDWASAIENEVNVHNSGINIDDNMLLLAAIYVNVMSLKSSMSGYNFQKYIDENISKVTEIAARHLARVKATERAKDCMWTGTTDHPVKELESLEPIAWDDIWARMRATSS